LAYGSITLLRDTRLRLKKNMVYGLLGPNNCGKTTLMRAIANEQVEGFPKRDELRTVFVEHEIEEREVGLHQEGGVMGVFCEGCEPSMLPGEKGKCWFCGECWPCSQQAWPVYNVDLSGADWVVDTCNNVYGLEPKINRDDAERVMEDIGFGNSAKGMVDRAADLSNGVTTYSGGWKMKMQLCAAQMMNADILMLDEPTGHLDVNNIAMIKDWLRAFPGTIIATSHDSGFLNDMTTHIIDFEDRKLKVFKGEVGSTLDRFVERYPEKRSYFELRNDKVKFVFPEPGPLEGVKSKGKTILKMADATFTYPTKSIPTIMDINLQVCMLSRVAVIGANGAGKSTAIKLLVGEAKPEKGTVTKAPGMRMAYVAQHAFHHLEKHLTKTPTQYILQRFAGNDDAESLEFKNREASEDEEKLRAMPWCVDVKSLELRKCLTTDDKDGKADRALAVVPDAILNRRKNKAKKFEYETKWQNKPIDAASWVERETLIAMGYIKFIQREDEKQAAAAGLMSKQLTQPAVEKHLADFAIDAESASHTNISALSGGQKVKVVIAAAMWQNPHILILDEPTNYLDREGLGALTMALKDFGGGVIIISHNREFADTVSNEKWIMDKGRLRQEGGADLSKDEAFGAGKGEEEVFDGAGNKIDVKRDNMSEKDKKKKIKELEKKLKDHNKKACLEEEQMYELMDLLEKYKSEIAAN
jgi:elongation factor 3